MAVLTALGRVLGQIKRRKVNAVIIIIGYVMNMIRVQFTLEAFYVCMAFRTIGIRVRRIGYAAV